MIIIGIDKEELMKESQSLIVNVESTDILKKSLSILKINKGNVKRKICFTIMEIFVATVVAQQTKTITVVKDIVEVFLNTMIALLAIVFTGYAFFQALLNDRLLIALMSDNSSETNKLAETNYYFVKVMMSQIFCLAINILVVVMMIALPDEWAWLNNNKINESIAGVLFFLYLHLNVECIWEMKSFVFNTFQLFNLYAYSRITKILNAKRKK